MNDYTNQPETLEDTLQVTEDLLQDIQKYSVYHKDNIQPEIDMIESAIKSIRYKELKQYENI